MNDEQLCPWWSSTEDGELVWHAVLHDTLNQDLAVAVMADVAAEYCPYCGGLVGEIDASEALPPRFHFLDDSGRFGDE